METKHEQHHLNDQSNTRRGEQHGKSGAPDAGSFHCIFVGQMKKWNSMQPYQYHFLYITVEEEDGLSTN